MQVQAVAQKQDQLLGAHSGPPDPLGDAGNSATAEPLLPAARPLLRRPLSRVPPLQATPKRLADVLGPPPPVRVHASQLSEEEPLPGISTEELVEDTSGNALAQAMLLQARALTLLVGQISTASSDPLTDLQSTQKSFHEGDAWTSKAATRTGPTDGSFFERAYQAAARRMDPTVSSAQAAELSQQGPVMQRYLERYGGFSKNKELGLIQWQLTLALDLFAKREAKGADTIAQIMIMVKQWALDGRSDLAWLLTLQPDPPNSVFQDDQQIGASSLRPFSSLADQRIIATTLAYVKELDALTTKGQSSQSRRTSSRLHPGWTPRRLRGL